MITIELINEMIAFIQKQPYDKAAPLMAKIESAIAAQKAEQLKKEVKNTDKNKKPKTS